MNHPQTAPGHQEGHGGSEHHHPKQFHILVNGKPFSVPGPFITVDELILLAQKAPPEKYAVYRRIHGQQQPNPLPPNEPVDLCVPGGDQFLVLPKVQPDGLDNPRREFKLPARDLAALESLNLPWEAISQGGICRLVIYGFELPEGYATRVVDVGIQIETGYPDTALDMARFSPPLARSNGRPIIKTSNEGFDGRNWQCWSRHRDQNDRWMPGVDDLASHLACIRMWLAAEVTR